MRWLPWLVAAAWCVPLSVVDLREHRLPNRLVAQLTVALAVVMGAAIAAGDSRSTRSIATVSASYVATHTAVYLASRGQFGMGDVKFSLPLGMLIGWYAPGAWTVSAMLSFALAAVVSVTLVATRAISLRSRIAFGPYMAAAALLVSLMPLLGNL